MDEPQSLGAANLTVSIDRIPRPRAPMRAPTTTLPRATSATASAADNVTSIQRVTHIEITECSFPSSTLGAECAGLKSLVSGLCKEMPANLALRRVVRNHAGERASRVRW
jgi:hypothetical protein